MKFELLRMTVDMFELFFYTAVILYILRRWNDK